MAQGAAPPVSCLLHNWQVLPMEQGTNAPDAGLIFSNFCLLPNAGP